MLIDEDYSEIESEFDPKLYTHRPSASDKS